MNKDTSHVVASHQKNTVLFILFAAGITMLLNGVILYRPDLGPQSLTLLLIGVTVLSLANLVIAFMLLRSSRVVQKSRTLMALLRDQRSRGADNDALAAGSIAMVAFCAAYGLLAVVLKVLAGNDALFNLSGFLVANLILATGAITYAVKRLRKLQKRDTLEPPVAG